MAAFEVDLSVQTIQSLIIHVGTVAFHTKNTYGETPLMAACSRGGFWSEEAVNFEVVKLLLESYPEALCVADLGGNTPLHIPYKNDEASLNFLRLLVSWGGAKAFGMLDSDGKAPLQKACGCGYPADILDLMIATYPDALDIVDNSGQTSLHGACRSDVPVATLRVMINHAPATCLVLEEIFGADALTLTLDDEEDHYVLPLDWALYKEGEANALEREATTLELLLNASKDAVCAMMECAFISRITMLTTVTNHVRATITRAMPAFNENSLMTLAVHDHLDPDLIMTLVNNEDLQELLKTDKAYHTLIAGLVHMNKSGRGKALRDHSNKCAGVSVLNSTADNADCLYLHLRESPSLCD
jgi:hypothetical protein